MCPLATWCLATFPLSRFQAPGSMPPRLCNFRSMVPITDPKVKEASDLVLGKHAMTNLTFSVSDAVSKIWPKTTRGTNRAESLARREGADVGRVHGGFILAEQTKAGKKRKAGDTAHTKAVKTRDDAKALLDLKKSAEKLTSVELGVLLTWKMGKSPGSMNVAGRRAMWLEVMDLAEPDLPEPLSEEPLSYQPQLDAIRARQATRAAATPTAAATLAATAATAAVTPAAVAAPLAGGEVEHATADQLQAQLARVQRQDAYAGSGGLCVDGTLAEEQGEPRGARTRRPR
jgi:hypothetical protein